MIPSPSTKDALHCQTQTVEAILKKKADKAKRMRAAWEDDYLLQVLNG
jgi:hypothetical protein